MAIASCAAGWMNLVVLVLLWDSIKAMLVALFVAWARGLGVRSAALYVPGRMKRTCVRGSCRGSKGQAATSVPSAVMERDDFVASSDQRIGATLREMTEVEGLTLREVIEWCGDAVTEREATRLRRLASEGADEQAEPAGSAGPVADVVAVPEQDGGGRAGRAAG